MNVQQRLYHQDTIPVHALKKHENLDTFVSLSPTLSLSLSLSWFYWSPYLTMQKPDLQSLFSQYRFKQKIHFDSQAREKNLLI